MLNPTTKSLRVSRFWAHRVAVESSGLRQVKIRCHRADFGKSEGSDDVGLDGLDFVGLAPVDIGATHDAGSIEDVGGLKLGYVSFEGGPVLEATRAVLGPAEGAEVAAKTARVAIDEKV
ncbi:hypothetical protein JHK85_006854 [Glycine max]|nr:hypothetical protein JHK85_006854 [Glycine max]KAG5071448.1 hypothetical protein JHK86_006659 [Glycine max]